MKRTMARMAVPFTSALSPKSPMRSAIAFATSARGRISAAPTRGPAMLPRPPITGPARMSMLIATPKTVSGKRLPLRRANKPPPMLVMAALTATASTFNRNGWTPSARAASSFSRMARQR